MNIKDKRKKRVRAGLSVSPDRPRLSVFRSLNHTYAQIINNGKVVVDVQKDRNQFIISIIDQGVGMTEDKMAQLFDKGKHITTVGTNNEIGTGLGLMLVKELVEKQGGKLSIKSRVGEGSTFSFTLMAYNEDDNMK